MGYEGEFGDDGEFGGFNETGLPVEGPPPQYGAYEPYQDQTPQPTAQPQSYGTYEPYQDQTQQPGPMPSYGEALDAGAGAPQSYGYYEPYQEEQPQPGVPQYGSPYEQPTPQAPTRQSPPKPAPAPAPGNDGGGSGKKRRPGLAELRKAREAAAAGANDAPSQQPAVPQSYQVGVQGRLAPKVIQEAGLSPAQARKRAGVAGAR